MKSLRADSDLQKTIDEENAYWTKVFSDELKKNSNTLFSSYWWENYYTEITKLVHSTLADIKDPKILEAGCGSGKASILLGERYDRTLLDISESALEFAKVLAKKFKTKDIIYAQGDIFQLPYRKNTFNFTWNLGVVEHYDQRKVIRILREMIRVTKNGGWIAVAVPNFHSGPMLKARLLKLPIFGFIPGYRVGTENNYTAETIAQLFKKACRNENAKPLDIQIHYFGNPLPMETPKVLVRTLGSVLNYLFPKNRFLFFVLVKVRKTI